MLKDYLPEKPSDWDKSQKEWEEYWLSVLVCNSLNALKGECRIIGQKMDKQELEYYPIAKRQIKHYERSFEMAQMAIHALMERVKEFEEIDICDPDRAKCPWCGHIGIKHDGYAEAWYCPDCGKYLCEFV